MDGKYYPWWSWLYIIGNQPTVDYNTGDITLHFPEISSTSYLLINVVIIFLLWCLIQNYNSTALFLCTWQTLYTSQRYIPWTYYSLGYPSYHSLLWFFRFYIYTFFEGINIAVYFDNISSKVGHTFPMTIRSGPGVNYRILHQFFLNSSPTGVSYMLYV